MKTFIKTIGTWLSDNWWTCISLILLGVFIGITWNLNRLELLLAPTTIIAGIATLIAYQQWRTNQQKLDIELYDRRLRIYIEVKTFLRKIIANADINTEDIANLWESTLEVDFIFSPKIRTVLNEITDHAGSCKFFNTQFHTPPHLRPPQYDSKEIAAGIRKESDWFIQHFEPVTKLFKGEMGLLKNNFF